MSVNRARERHRRKKHRTSKSQDTVATCGFLVCRTLRREDIAVGKDATVILPASRNLRFFLSSRVQFVIPLMLVFITARAVGNRFNQGIYDTQISIKKMPFLEQV